jgi:type VI secretion system protein ImpF
MAEPTPMDRLLPCLLDRLTDETPESRKESATRRVMSLQRYRAGVRRDLEDLLNTSCHTDDEPICQSEQVASSVLNFGIPDLCGQTVSGVSVTDIERRIRQAILNYEPRIVPGTLRVRVDSRPEAMSSNAVTFEITGDLWAMPAPDPLYYRTEVDLETGRFAVKDRAHG